MTVSAKVPTSRNGNATTAGNGGGPIAAPRVVNNRRLRTGGVLLGVLLLVLGAALSGLALLSATRTSAYLAVSRPVQVGSQITAADLTTVELSGGQGLSAIPANQINSVVGRHAAVTLYPGTLIAAAQLNNQTLLQSGEAEIGIRSSNLTFVKPGDQILLVPLNTAGGTGAAGTISFNATVIDVGTPGSDGSVSLHVAVSAAEAPTILTYSNGGLGIVLKPRD
jgi:hypothetical protein